MQMMGRIRTLASLVGFPEAVWQEVSVKMRWRNPVKALTLLLFGRHVLDDLKETLDEALGTGRWSIDMYIALYISERHTSPWPPVAPSISSMTMSVGRLLPILDPASSAFWIRVVTVLPLRSSLWRRKRVGIDQK